ncbi:MAG: twin-arginine translocase subunit TatC [Parcubacteria group bacterium]
MAFVWDELKELKRIFIPWVYIFGVLGIGFFSVPVLEGKTIAAEAFLQMKSMLVPKEVEFIVTEPVSAFVVQVGIALMISFILTSPFFFYRLAKYISGALYDKERRTLRKLFLPAAFLFAAGAVFGYFIILPPTFKILYEYAGNIGAKPFFSVSDFAVFTLGFTFACGIMFLLPVAMGILNFVGVTNRAMWKKNWRYAFLIFLIVSAIITPDGSGVTMIMLSLPLTGLYFVGSVAGGNGRKQTKKDKK